MARALLKHCERNGRTKAKKPNQLLKYKQKKEKKSCCK